MSTQNAVVAVSNPSTTRPMSRPEMLKAYFGDGRYFSIQCEVLSDVMRLFNFPEEKGVKIAKAVASHLGAIFKHHQVSISVSNKLSKDGGVKTISEVCKIKNLTLTDPIALLRAIDYCTDASSYHVEAVFKLDSNLTAWVEGL